MAAKGNGAYPKSVQPGIPCLGLLPKGWQSFFLGDLVKEVSRPAQLEDDVEYRQVSAKRSRGGIVFRGVQRGSKIKTKTQYFVEAGDFLISRRQIVHGGCGTVPAELNGAIVSNEYLVLHSNGKLLQEYLRWLSHSLYFQQTCFHASIGVHVEKMVFKPEWWFRSKFYIPPKEEQERITKLLNIWDKAITQIERLISINQKLKKGLTSKLLSGQMRLPNFNTKWEKTSFAVVLSHHSGNSSLIKGNLSSAKSANFYPAYSASGQDVWHNTYEHEGDAIVVSAVGSRCGKSFVTSGKWSAIANTHVVWPVTSKIDIQFLGFHLNDESFWLKSGSGQPFVLFKQSFARWLKLPSLAEQAAISSILGSIDHKTNLFEKKLMALQEQKRGLIQKLLTGQVRVKI